ncbi:MAG: hypothetical protein KGJ23_08630 [Euryarchaeota archaeon]|nr:hypothetical protein [Euryarchaeota archaeon]MDE1836668.1 hypothetical protein [Euryarchaeota archaeon]MDE1880303.1 hypothetical protein [Euryarchaeota archaeon]MDE2044638.1 hypothetical protein [Thermoplasmata archaeon]
MPGDRVARLREAREVLVEEFKNAGAEQVTDCEGGSGDENQLCLAVKMSDPAIEHLNVWSEDFVSPPEGPSYVVVAVAKEGAQDSKGRPLGKKTAVFFEENGAKLGGETESHWVPGERMTYRNVPKLVGELRKKVIKAGGGS